MLPQLAALFLPLAALIPDELLGPDGLVIGAVALLVIIGRLHLQQDARDRAEKNEYRKAYIGVLREFGKLAEADERDLGIESP